MTPEGWHKLFRWPTGANVFWKGNGFGVSAGHSRMRRARLAGMNGCFGVDPVAPCRIHARRWSHGKGGVEGGVGKRYVCDRQRKRVWLVK